MRIAKVISGGQTGVDRAALDVAIELGIDHGGWCPRGRKAEDGRIPDRYNLVETAETDYRARTALNVYGATATLLITSGRVTPGTLMTDRLATKYERPCMWVNLAALVDRPRPQHVRGWLERHPGILNVAGSRESSSPGIGKAARAFLLEVLR